MSRSANRIAKKKLEQKDLNEKTLLEINCGGANLLNCNEKIFTPMESVRSSFILGAALRTKDWRLLDGKIGTGAGSRRVVTAACPKCWLNMIKAKSPTLSSVDSIVNIVESFDPDRKFVTDEIFDSLVDSWEEKNRNQEERV